MSKGRGGKTLWSLAAIVVLVGAVVTAAGIFPFRQLIAERRSVAQAQETLLALRAENERLAGEVAVLETDDEVERLARERGIDYSDGDIALVTSGPELGLDWPKNLLAGWAGRRLNSVGRLKVINHKSQWPTGRFFILSAGGFRRFWPGRSTPR